MKYRGNLKEKKGQSGNDVLKAPRGEKFLAGGEVEIHDEKFRAPNLEAKAVKASGKRSGKSLASGFAGKAMTGRGGARKRGGRGFSAKEAAAILGKRC